MDGTGTHQFWGFSPAVDYQQVARTVMGASWPPAPGASTAAAASAAASSDSEPLHILLVQPGDPRSVMKTIAQRYRHSRRPLHFTIFEKPVEVLARHVLLLAVATDWELPIRQRAALYLEIFGNALVQTRTAKYIAAKRLQLVDMLTAALALEAEREDSDREAAAAARAASAATTAATAATTTATATKGKSSGKGKASVVIPGLGDLDAPSAVEAYESAAAAAAAAASSAAAPAYAAPAAAAQAPVVSSAVRVAGKGMAPLNSVLQFGSLKFKERDALEFTFKTWGDDVPFDMPLLREYRMRHQYGERYDFRVNLFDWDYNNTVKKCAGSIHWRTFKEWRESGIAYEFGDQKYDAPNRSLASYVEGREQGRSTERRGFWGDIVASPYHGVGTAAFVPTDEEAAAATAAAEVAAAAAAAASGSRSSSSDTSNKPTASGNFAYQLFDIVSRLSGSEQWRHHAVEIAVYNLLCWLFELETGRQYVMRDEHDVYSGLADAMPAVLRASKQAVATKPGEGESAAAAAAAAEEHYTDGGAGAGAGADHAAVQAAMRATAAARARTIARSFRHVSVHLVTGDFNELLERRKFPSVAPEAPADPAPSGASGASGASSNGSASGHSGYHVIHLSGKAVHHMNNPLFSSVLCHPAGTVILAETARNVPVLQDAAREEFQRRLLLMAGCSVGAAFVGPDRALSADTFSVGTVLNPPKPAEAADAEGQGDGSATGGKLVPAKHMFVPLDGGVEGHLPAVAAVGGATAATGTAANATTSTEKQRMRAKRVGMTSYTHNPVPHPAVAPLLSAAAATTATAATTTAATAATGAAAADAASPALQAAARNAAMSIRGYVRGISTHDHAKGDNPPPEALVFAYVPAAAPLIRAALSEAGARAPPATVAAAKAEAKSEATATTATAATATASANGGAGAGAGAGTGAGAGQ